MHRLAVVAVGLLAGLCLASPVPLESAAGASLRISGGVDADVQGVPYVAALEVAGEHVCGAAIVADRWVLTSALCVADAAQLGVRVGSSTRASGGVLHAVAQVVAHAKYDATTLAYNLALLQTSAAVATSPSARPVALVEAGARPRGGARLLVSGWGLEDLGEHWKPSALHSLSVRRLPQSLCRTAYAKGVAAVVDDGVLCARGQDWKGICEGDFGGPLVNDLLQLVGVASWGEGCGHPRFPGAYVDLAKQDVNDWVRATIAGTAPAASTTVKTPAAGSTTVKTPAAGSTTVKTPAAAE